MTEDYFNKHYKEYDNWYEQNKETYEFELRILKKYKKYINVRSLEIGVGSGRFAMPLGIKYGIDNSPKLLSIANKRGIICKEARAENIPFENDYFDFIGVFFSLSFFKNIEKVFMEIKRLLSSKGKVLFLIINKAGGLAKSYLQKKGFYENANFFDFKEVLTYLERIALKPLDIYGFDMGKQRTYANSDVNFFNSDLFLILGEQI